MKNVVIPKGARNFYGFVLFFYLTLTATAGAPMLLYFKRLGATAAIIGLVGGIAFFLDTLQIPAAKFVERTGYKRFLIRGQLIMAGFVLLAATMASFYAWTDSLTQILLMLFLLFWVHSARSISFCALFPWITHIVPERMRGKFMSGFQMSICAAIILTTLSTALYFERFNELWHFVPVFFVGVLTALMGVFFLKRVPDAEFTPEMKSREPVPWRAILNHRPFQRLLLYQFVAINAYAPNIFLHVPFLKDMCGASDAQVMWINLLYGLTAICALFVFSKVMDRTGHRPILKYVHVMLAVHFLGWGLVAAKVLPLTLPTILFVQITAGLGFSLFNVSNFRMAMAVIPEMGRSHFFAVFNALRNLTLGCMPFVWGWIIDRFMPFRSQWGGLEWNIYTVFYLALILISLSSLIFLEKVPDSNQMSVRGLMKELFVRLPARAMARLFSIWFRNIKA